MNDQDLSALQPCVNHSLVIFPLKTAFDPWVIKVILSKSDKWRHFLQRLDQKHVALDWHPSQSINPRQQLGPYILAYRYLRHLKRDDPAMADHLRSDLDQFGQ